MYKFPQQIDIRKKLEDFKFTAPMMAEMRFGARSNVLSLLYNNCISESSLISHGFTPQQITTLLSRDGGSNCMDEISKNYDILKKRCNNEEMILIGCYSGGSVTISVYSSEIYTRLIDLKYTKEQILSMALRPSASSYMKILANNTGRITRADTDRTPTTLFNDLKNYITFGPFKNYIQGVCAKLGVEYVGTKQNVLPSRGSTIHHPIGHPQAPTEHRDKKQKIDECNMIETPLGTSTTQMFRSTISNSTPIELDSDSDSDVQVNDNIEMEPTFEQKENSTTIDLGLDLQLNDNIEMEPTLEQKENSSPIAWGDNLQHNHSIYIDAEPDHTAVLLAHNYFSCLFSPNDEFYARELKEDDFEVDERGMITIKKDVTGIRLM